MTSYNYIIQKKFKEQQGATAVEFALIIAFVFIPLLFGIIEFGLLVYNQHIITNAGREGARAGVVFRSDRINEQKIQDVVIRYARNNLINFSGNKLERNDIDVDNLSTTGNSKCVNSEDKLRITIAYSYDYLFLKLFLDPTDMTSETTMTCE